ncbi:hypothetical protein C1H76_7215 [Elsinoe australis]|uniref:Uncharacterized protein n=1 Tax=Elsinoe australis TaxID=40998 RepID=A0A4U7ATJ4_9PEZI|nr:hypothetical protein C1H76_7215 [Elsinoe australis]
MKVSLLSATLIGSAIAAPEATTREACKERVAAIVYDYLNPVAACKYFQDTNNNFVKAYETINDDLGYMSGKVDYSCDCVIKYPGLAKSTRNVSAPGAGVKQTEQQKAFHKLKVQTDQVPQFCRAWLDDTVDRTKSPFPKISGPGITSLCETLFFDKVSVLPEQDAAAPNLFTNPGLDGSGDTQGTKEDKVMGTSLNLPGWNYTGGIIFLSQPATKNGTLLKMSTYFTKAQKKNSIVQTVSGLEPGRDYRIYFSESWKCDAYDTSDKSKAPANLCQWDLLVDGKSIWTRKSNKASSGPRLLYRNPDKLNGPHTFTATSTQHNIRFRQQRNGDRTAGGISLWKLYNVTMTGPWGDDQTTDEGATSEGATS